MAKKKKPTIDLAAVMDGTVTIEDIGHEDFVPMSQIKPASPAWYWRRRLVKNDLNILAGTQGLGKSQVAVSIAAEATRRGEVVLVVSAEDSPETTIVPRLIASGAESRAPDGSELVYVHRQSGTWSLEEAKKLQEWIERTEASFVIIDPVAAYVSSKTDTYKDAHVRGMLAPLRAIAEDQECTILAVMHLKKGSEAEAVNNVGGSIAWTAAPRSVLMVRRLDDDKSARVLYHAKCNVGPEQPALLFTIESVEYGELGSWATSVVVWGEEDPNLDAQSEFAPRAPAPQSSAAADALTWLTAKLADGEWSDTHEINTEAGIRGLSARSLDKAKRALGVDTKNFAGTWRIRKSESPS